MLPRSWVGFVGSADRCRSVINATFGTYFADARCTFFENSFGS